MKNVFRIGSCAVAVAMTTGCVAEALDEEIDVASSEQAAFTCTAATPDAILSVTQGNGNYVVSTSSSASYGTSSCPNQYLVELNFPKDARAHDAIAYIPTSELPNNPTDCAKLRVEVTMFGYLPPSPITPYGLWYTVGDDSAQGQWFSDPWGPSGHCDVSVVIPRPALKNGGKFRVAGRAWIGGTITHKRVSVGVRNAFF